VVEDRVVELSTCQKLFISGSRRRSVNSLGPRPFVVFSPLIGLRYRGQELNLRFICFSSSFILHACWIVMG